VSINRAKPGPDYTLRWPRPLFIREARVLADEPDSDAHDGQVELLLEEAFLSDQPLRDFKRSCQPSSPWDVVGTTARLGAAALGRSQRQQHLDDLIAAAPRMPEQAAPRPYYTQRRETDPILTPSAPRIDEAKRAWKSLMADLLERGYLDRAARRPCVDDHSTQDVTQYDLLDADFAQRLGGGYGPLDRSPEACPDEHFFAMIEVGHDLVARPRRRRWHDYDHCGWHYSDFSVAPAQILYRWSVNRLLIRQGIDLQLAKSGEDVGRLVHTTFDGREDLVAATASPSGPDGDEVRHAVALFRAREAGVEHKRSACTTLARVLESRRGLLKAELFKKDEGALFHIANEFDLRHRGADQHADYDEAYLDWIFWWYLATVELSDRLLTRKAGPR